MHISVVIIRDRHHKGVDTLAHPYRIAVPLKSILESLEVP